MKLASQGVRRTTIAFFISATVAMASFSACEKLDIFDHHPGKGNKPTSFSSEVVEKWLALQLRLVKNATGPNHGFSRHFAYSGIAAWESIAPGLPASAQLKKDWNGLTGLPQFNRSKNYYWPANANAALAAINRSFFPNANAADKAAIDSLENALNAYFLTQISSSVLDNSAQFGKLVALAVYNWSETDGYKNANAPYTLPVGDGLWKLTSAGSPATPYWGNNRPVMKGSTNNVMPIAPPPYSTDPNSFFYKMNFEVWDLSQTLTNEQRAMAIFWKDVPGGATTPGHWISILHQVLDKENTSLAKATLAYALCGTAINDAAISVMKAKYTYNLIRPVTYIREQLGHTMWEPALGTPLHPEYPSAHSSLSGATAEILQSLFGKNMSPFTDHTYDYLGYAPRTFPSYSAIAVEAGQSRLFAGIHFQFSIDQGTWQGKKIASNILNQCPRF